MMDLFSLAPVVFGENGSEIHPRSSSPSDLSSRPQYEENRFLDFPFFSFLWPFDIFVAVDRFPKESDRLWPRAYDVNSYDGCAACVSSDVRYTCPDVNLLAWTLDGGTQ